MKRISIKLAVAKKSDAPRKIEIYDDN